jgi:hypothetical protein
MNYKVLIRLAKALFGEFCKVYGQIISLDVAVEFLNQVDDLREVNEKYVDYLYDYAVDYNLVGC